MSGEPGVDVTEDLYDELVMARSEMVPDRTERAVAYGTEMLRRIAKVKPLTLEDLLDAIGEKTKDQVHEEKLIVYGAFVDCVRKFLLDESDVSSEEFSIMLGKTPAEEALSPTSTMDGTLSQTITSGESENVVSPRSTDTANDVEDSLIEALHSPSVSKPEKKDVPQARAPNSKSGKAVSGSQKGARRSASASRHNGSNSPERQSHYDHLHKYTYATIDSAARRINRWWEENVPIPNGSVSVRDFDALQKRYLNIKHKCFKLEKIVKSAKDSKHTARKDQFSAEQKLLKNQKAAQQLQDQVRRYQRMKDRSDKQIDHLNDILAKYDEVVKTKFENDVTALPQLAEGTRKVVEDITTSRHIKTWASAVVSCLVDAAPVHSEKAYLEKEIDRLVERIDNLHDKNREVTTELTSTEKHLQDLQADYAQLESKFEDVCHEKSDVSTDLSKKITELQHEKSELADKLKSADEDILRWRKRWQDLSESEMKVSEDLILSLKMQVAMENEIGQLRSRTGATSAELDQFNNQLEDTVKQCEMLDQDVRKWKDQCETATRHLTESQEENAQLEAKVVRFRTELEELEDQIRELEEERSKSAAAVTDSTSELESMQKEIDRLQTELEQIPFLEETVAELTEECNRFSEENASIPKLEEELASATKECDQLRSEIENAAANTSSVGGKVKELETVCQEKDDEIQSLRRDNSRLSNHLSDRDADLEDRETRVKALMEKLQRAQQTALEESEIQEKELAKLRTRLRTVEDERDRLQEEFAEERAAAATALADVRVKLASAEEAKGLAEQKLLSVSTALQEAESGRDENAAKLASVSQTHVVQLAAVQGERDALAQQIQTLESNATTAAGDTALLRSEIAAKDAEISRLKESLQSTSSSSSEELDSVRAATALVENDLHVEKAKGEELSAKCSALTAEIESLRSAVSAKDSQLQADSARIQSLEADLTAQKSQAVTAAGDSSAQLEELQGKYGELDAECTQLRIRSLKTAELERSVESLRAECDAEKGKVGELERELETLRSSTSSTANEAGDTGSDELANENEQLRAQVEALRAQVSSAETLQSELQEAQSKIAELESRPPAAVEGAPTPERLVDLEEQCSQLRIQLMKSRDKEKQLVLATARIAELEEQVAAVQAPATSGDGDAAGQGDQVAQLQAQLAQEKDKLLEAQDQVARLEYEVEALEDEIEYLGVEDGPRAALEELRRQLVEAKVDAGKSGSGAAEGVESTGASAGEEVQSAAQGDQSTYIEELKASLSKSEAACEELKKERSELFEKCVTLSDATLQAQAETVELRNELSRCQRELEEFQHEMEASFAEEDSEADEPLT